MFPQVATYKILDLQAPFLIENNPFSAKYRSANCQFAPLMHNLTDCAT